MFSLVFFLVFFITTSMSFSSPASSVIACLTVLYPFFNAVIVQVEGGLSGSLEPIKAVPIGLKRSNRFVGCATLHQTYKTKGFESHNLVIHDNQKFHCGHDRFPFQNWDFVQEKR